jgi:hypothetical protein
MSLGPAEDIFGRPLSRAAARPVAKESRSDSDDVSRTAIGLGRQADSFGLTTFTGKGP